MSFQAYLDAIETKTGKTPQQLLDEAHAKGFDPTTKAGVVAEWLREDYGVGRGHAMAFFHVLKNGPRIGDKHLDTTGAHRDASTELRLDGLAGRALPRPPD
ncbi:MAG: DUF4287 domain-containing protein [Terracoccus sp.]